MENTEKLIPMHKEVKIRCPQTHGQWVTTSMWYHPVVALESYEDYQEIKRFENFEEFYIYCDVHGIRNCENYFNWRKKPTVCVNDATNLTRYYFSARSFKWFEVKVEYIPKPNWSIDFLRKELPASSFAELCKSQGWEIF